MVDSLSPLLADGVVDEVVSRLKSGKEADLWLVRHGGELVAAKAYKSRQTRSFRNDSAYREGRRVRDSRTQRAMDRGSRFGQAAAEDAWKAKEADALYALHAAGVRVPRPVMFYEGVLLMELVLGADGRPAPRLVDAQVSREQAGPLYSDLRAQAIRMLGCDLVHGDLSPYNVLAGRAGPVIIDFPQVVGAAHNSQAEAFFRRDLENLRRFFAAVDPALHAAAGDAREIWQAYVRRELTPGFVPSGRAEQAPRSARGERRARPQPARGGGEGRAHRGGEGHHGRGDRGTQPGGRAMPPVGGRGEARTSEAASPRTPGRRGGASMPEVIRVGRPAPGQPPAGPPRAGRPGPGQAPAGPPRGANGHGSAHGIPHAAQASRAAPGDAPSASRARRRRRRR